MSTIKISELPINTSPINNKTSIVGVDSSGPTKISIQIPLTALSSSIFNISNTSANNQILYNYGGTVIGSDLEWETTNKSLRIKRDATNYWDANVGINGDLKFTGVGTAANLTFTPAAGQKILLNSTAVGINMTPLTVFNVADTANTSPRGILSSQFSTDTGGAGLGCSKARGTPTGPSIVVTGDMLGRHMFRGHDGSNYLEMASIDVGVSGTVVATRVPTYMSFSTATDASPSVLTERLRIDNAGNMGLGITAPVSRWHIISTTEQERIGYDTSNYWNQTVGSTGLMSWSGVGAGGALTITPTAGQNVNIVLGTTALFNVTGNTAFSGYLNQNSKTLRYSGSKVLSNNVSTTLFSIPIANTTGIGAFGSFTVVASNTTNIQTRTGSFNIAASCTSVGVITSNIANSTTEGVALSTGTLTNNGFTITNGSNILTVNANCNSNLLLPTVTLTYKLNIHSTSLVTLL